MNYEVNVWALSAATIVSMVIGYVWYGSQTFGFGKVWAEHARVDIKKINVPALIMAAISAFFMAWGLSYATFVVTQQLNFSDMMSALLVGLFVTLGFQVLRMIQRALFNQDSGVETAIHVSNEFTTVMAAAFIIGLFGI